MLGARFLIGGLFAAALLATIALAYRHHASVVTEARVQAERAAGLEVRLGVADEARAVLQESLEAHRQAAARLQGDLELAREDERRARAETRRLNELYAKHDLTALALARPGLIERRVNAGTARVGRLLECASGLDSDDCRGGGGAAGEAGPPPP